MTWISSLHLNYLTCQRAELYAFHENDIQGCDCIAFTAYFWLPASHGISMYAQWLSLCLSVWFSPRLRLSLGTATPVDEHCRTGAAAPGGSCWVTLTHSSRHAHTHTHAQYARLEKNLDEHLTYLYFTFMALLYLYSVFVGASVKVMFISTEQLFKAFFFWLGFDDLI